MSRYISSAATRLLPLDRRRRLRADVVHDAVDALDLVDDARRDACEQVVRQARPVSRHAVLALDRANRGGVFEGPLATHHTDAVHWQQHRAVSPRTPVPALAPPSLRDDPVAPPQQGEAIRCHRAENPDGQSRPGKWLADDEFLVQSELTADDPDFVLEELAQRLDERHAHAIGQAADVVVTLDARRLSDNRNRFDDVRIQRPLSEKIDPTEVRRLLLEHVDERRTDDFALLFGIDDAGEPIEKQLRCIDEHEWKLQSLEALPYLTRFVESQDAVVDEDTRQLIADGATNEQRRDRRVDAAAQRADDASAVYLLSDPRRRLVDKRRHRPVAGAAADAEREVTQDLEAALGVHDLRMEQQRVELALRMRHRGHRRIRAGRDDGEAIRRGGDEVTVAGPHADLVGHLAEQRGRIGGSERTRPTYDADFRVAELALRRRRDATAERVRHQLHAVADAEHRFAEVVDLRIAFRRARLRHALGSAREDDPHRIPRADFFDRRVRRPHFRVHRQFSQPPSDELGVLRAEIQNDDGLVVHLVECLFQITTGPLRCRGPKIAVEGSW